jgi:general secretion pathway protein I
MDKRGFTLIEVVVALAILGVGLVVIIELFSGGLRLGKAAEEYTKAVGFARAKMEEISVLEKMEEGEKEGEFDKEYRWKMETKKMELLSMEKNPEYKPPVDFYQVKFTVFWKSASKEKSTTIETYRTVKPEDEGQQS